MMKLVALTIAAFLASTATAFVAAPAASQRVATTSLAAVDRRQFVAASAAAAFLGAAPAFAARGADYKPVLKDVKQIYELVGFSAYYCTQDCIYFCKCGSIN